MRSYYLAVCFGYWGRGATEEEALKQCRKAGGSKKDQTFVYRVDVEIETDPTQPGKVWKIEDGQRYEIDGWKPYVTADGTMCWHGKRTKVAEYRKGKRLEEAAA